MEEIDGFQESMKEKYVRVKELIDIKHTKDPDDEPYRSKYLARDILKEMETSIKERNECGIKEKSMLTAVYTLLGTICMDVDEPVSGEEYLHKSLKLVETEECSDYFILSTLCTLNQLALLYSMRQEDEKALVYLERADNLYNEYKELKTVSPLGYHFLFTNDKDTCDEKGKEMFEKTHTLTFYYMAQVFKAMGNTIESAVFCHNTLRRQLETNDYDKIDWALNSASLSQYFTEQNAFKEARHHLAAASYMLSLKKKELDDIVDKNEEYEASLEQYNHRKSDVYRCWIKYCLSLLSRSKDRLMASDEDGANVIKVTPASLINKRFPSLQIDANENMVTADYLLTYYDAKPVVLFAQSCVNKATEYYTLEDHASDYVLIIQDSSQLYLFLAFFEEDESKTNKMPDRFPLEYERDALMAHLCTAQAYSKFVNCDKNKIIDYTKQSLHYYQAIVNYCKEYPDSTKGFQAELGICKDMVTLLPVKMNKLALQG
ncbi:KIF1-binding protein homolog isoform X2 [Cimex lectularius]|uniref:KIF-binding protein n=1 Tax=Cimex lectularius TaxID=79782 RepID=A0A8I6TGH5_CIMLE|nr:KIF1-binding protein homolog isoform X2 [Cimex lectularius]